MYPVHQISMSGNKRTKDFVILREMVVNTDSFYQENSIDEVLEISKNRILNLNLFNKVNVSKTLTILNGKKGYLVHIAVIEKWNIWPLPFVEFSDRNFNVWGDLNFDPERTNYGLYLFYYNLSGRNHTLKTKLKRGYNSEAGLEYRVPFVSQKSNWGFETYVDFSAQNEVWYRTRNDSVQFFRNGESNLINRAKVGVDFSNRIQPFLKAYIGAHYNYGRLDTAVPQENFFVQDAAEQKVVRVSAALELDTRDNVYYPLEGLYVVSQVDLERYSAAKNIHNLGVQFQIQKYDKLRDKIYSSINLTAQYNTYQRLGYANRKQLGYDYMLRGFEHYVMDGNASTRASAALRYHWLDKSDLELNFIPIKNYKVLPLNMYIELFSDAGYASDVLADESNSLTNRFLYSAGLGLNMLVYNDRLLRVEYSLNSLKEGGIFVHFKKAI